MHICHTCGSPRRFRRPAARPRRLLADEEVIDLGDHAFKMIHTPGRSPGHSPGDPALWEAATCTLLSGDLDDDLRSLERLRRLPVQVVHGGQVPSFGRERLHVLVDEDLAGRRRARMPYRLEAVRPKWSPLWPARQPTNRGC